MNANLQLFSQSYNTTEPPFNRRVHHYENASRASLHGLLVRQFICITFIVLSCLSCHLSLQLLQTYWRGSSNNKETINNRKSPGKRRRAERRRRRKKRRRQIVQKQHLSSSSFHSIRDSCWPWKPWKSWSLNNNLDLRVSLPLGYRFWYISVLLFWDIS